MHADEERDRHLVWLWLTSAAILFRAEVNAEVQRLADERSRRFP